MLPVAGQQLIGAAFVLGYITYFLSLIGIKEFFKASVALYCVMLASNLSAFGLIEVVGRRPLLVIGMFALTLIELVSWDPMRVRAVLTWRSSWVSWAS